MSEGELLLLSSKQNHSLFREFPPLMQAASQRGTIALIPYVDRSGKFCSQDAIVESSIQFLQSLGLKIKPLNPWAFKRSSFQETLQGTNGLYIFGGDPWHLLRAIQRVELVQILPEYFAKGGFYIGASAGSMLAGISMEPANYHPGLNHKNSSPNKDGLRLVDSIIWPHYRPDHKRFFKKFPGNLANQEIIRLNDSQALIVANGSERKIIDMPNISKTNGEIVSEDSLESQVKRGITIIQELLATHRGPYSHPLKEVGKDLNYLYKVINGHGLNPHLETTVRKRLQELDKYLSS